ncbi:MAG: Xaa-Pro peptidase family protein [Candidatus Bathyarchaeia archaeon]
MRKDVDKILAEKGVDSMLMYSDSVKNANMFYMTGFLAPDPFIFLKKVDEDPLIVVSQMEKPRAEKESRVKDVRSIFEYDYVKVIKSCSDPKMGGMKFVASVAKKELGGKAIYVPPHLSVVLADVLREEGLKIKPMFDVIEKARATKEPEEIEAIKTVQRVVEKATTEAISLIANSEIGSNNKLVYREDGKKAFLTVRKVRSVFDHTFVENGCIAEEETIVACGPRSADPHYSGEAHDVLKANQPIVLDVFPRSVKKRYVADMTRTVVKGKASKKVKQMFETVFETKAAVMDVLKAGVLGSEMQEMCYKLLEKAGYQTARGGKQITKGYMHGLGHGIGLEVHEEPRMSEFYDQPLQEHNIVSVEPGLYDPAVGGVRIEDIVEVSKTGCKNLTRMEVALEI